MSKLATIRPATEQDTPALLAFLSQHESTSMFPIADLLGKGIKAESWLFETAGAITGYLALNEIGTLEPQAPTADWATVRPLLAGRSISGLIGPAEQCAALQTALGLANTPTRMNTTEPGFTLNLTDLRLPNCEGYYLTPIRDQDLPLISAWRAANLIETMGFTLDTAPLLARTQVLRWQQDKTHRILWHDDTPVSLAGSNAQIPDVLQIGGVYTPPDLRNQGYARRVAAMLLAEARHAGIKRAVLFAASEAAARAYIALGFRPSHSFALIMFSEPQQVSA
ncbi:MAG: hypothetical protein JWS10_1280 [Cypionkella sp.]|uniref:GNAT family N-acetyltransferase n=1 Tax=Cypionkella sp. TaxID=2811411 RepID=UPI00262EA5BA|nr:GNAT family N-acetyltransferase [Cypionkella sp.]MDB5658665.1 hypothetical protein [Cypionkella sp.]